MDGQILRGFARRRLSRRAGVCADCLTHHGKIIGLPLDAGFRSAREDSIFELEWHLMERHKLWWQLGIEATPMVACRPHWQPWSRRSRDWLVLVIGHDRWGTRIYRGFVSRTTARLGGDGRWSAQVTCEDDPSAMDVIGTFSHRWQAKRAVEGSRCQCYSRPEERYAEALAQVKADASIGLHRHLCEYWWEKMTPEQQEAARSMTTEQ